MSTRIYVVTNRDKAEQLLIRASNPAQAIRHAARAKFGCAVAGQETIIDLLSEGVKVEDAATTIED